MSAPGLGPSPLTRGEDSLTVAQAAAAIAQAVQQHRADLGAPEPTPLAQCQGRVLAQALISPIDVPAHDNSAMDGYAFDGSALTAGRPRMLRCVGTVFAGAPHEGRIAGAQCLRIMTGAVMPAGTDTVVPHELVQARGDQVDIPADVVAAGDNLRRRGEDLAQGGVALQAGRVLRPADIGLAASLGLTVLPLRRRLRVALFSTGDELRAAGEPLPPGCIYDSNRESLRAALQRLGVEVLDLGLVADDPAALQATLQAAVLGADAVLTSGGVSMGDADHTRAVLARMGRVDFWKVAMRPGRPFAFGPIEHAGRSALLFALPGNPVAALVTFYAFVRDALLQLAGAQAQPLPRLKVPCAVPIRKRPGRTEFQRAVLERGADGRCSVRPGGSQGAGILRSMSEADALVVLGHEQGSLAAGEAVEVWLFDGLV